MIEALEIKHHWLPVIFSRGPKSLRKAVNNPHTQFQKQSHLNQLIVKVSSQTYFLPQMSDTAAAITGQTLTISPSPA